MAHGKTKSYYMYCSKDSKNYICSYFLQNAIWFVNFLPK